MKTTSRISGVMIVGAAASILFLAIGCVSLPTETAGMPSTSKTTYSATDVPQHQIPAVRSPYAGKTVAVIPYVNKTLSAYGFLGNASVGILPEYLLEAGFQPVESTEGNLQSVLAELKYSQSEGVNPSTAAQIGEQLGARYVFIGEVNNYRIDRASGNRTITVKGFALGAGGATVNYDIQVSGRLIDVQTRLIVASKSVAHTESFPANSGELQTPWGSFKQSQDNTVEQEVGGKILNIALSRLVDGIVSQLNTRQIATN